MINSFVAENDIEKGGRIGANESNDKVSPMHEGMRPVGVAARDIKRGERVLMDDNGDTADVVHKEESAVSHSGEGGTDVGNR